MFNQSKYHDSYDCEKLKLLQSLNEQVTNMAFKLDRIVSHVEEVTIYLP